MKALGGLNGRLNVSLRIPKFQRSDTIILQGVQWNTASDVLNWNRIPRTKFKETANDFGKKN